LLCEIEDNGIGREESRKQKSIAKTHHESMGMKMIEERLNTINKLSKNQIHLNIIDLKNENGLCVGTKVLFKIPIRYS